MKRFSRHFFILLLLPLLLCSDVFAAKKDFKGLFGSYRREKFTENEGGAGELGVDLMFSTLIPVTSIIQSQQTSGGDFANLNYATYFNLEGGLHYSLTYHWLLFAHVGYYSYDTRKKTDISPANQPTFHQFEMTTIPMLLGVKYRFTTSDIVPYLGLGLGASIVNQRAFYDSSTQNSVRNLTVPTGEVTGGFEFYFAPKAGIRLEVAAYYMQIPTATFYPGATTPGSTTNLPGTPAFQFSANLWSVRYASGLFFIF